MTNASSIVLEDYDNEAEKDGAAIVSCRVVMADGSEHLGTAPRTSDLAHDQAAALADALEN